MLVMMPNTQPKRPLVLHPETVKSPRDQERGDSPIELQPFHVVARNAHPGPSDVHSDE